MDKVRCLRKGSNDCTYHTGQPSLHVCEHVRWLYVNSVHPSIKTYQSISLIKKKFYGSFTKLAYQFPALDYVHLINKVLSSINIILSLKKKCQLELCFSLARFSHGATATTENLWNRGIRHIFKLIF